MASPRDRSTGFLPLSPLQHDAPTAVGLVELDRSLAIEYTAEDYNESAVDQLVLARLHGEPVATFHLASAPGFETEAELLAAVWREGETQIRGHIERCSCLPTPSGPQSLGEILATADADCREREPPRPDGRATVIVCTTGRTDVLERALVSLAQMQCDCWEIIVVDNRPGAGTTRALVDRLASDAQIRYIAEPRQGLSIARNAGVEAAVDSTYVAFTDDDVVVDQGWLGWLLAPFTNSGVHAVTGFVLPLKLQSPAEKRFELYSGFGKGVQAETYSPLETRDENRFRFLYPYWGGLFGSGNSMAFRRDALIALGGFDPALGAGTPTGGGEDLAVFSDIILQGARLAYEPRSVCWHEHRDTEADLRAQVRSYGVGLTAVFWRHLLRDPRFIVATVGLLPRLWGLVHGRSEDRQSGRTAVDLMRLEMRFRLLGPWRYMVARRNAKRG